MAENRRTRRSLSAVRAKWAEAVGGEEVEFETDDGEVFTFPHPLFADDEWQQRVDEAEGAAATARVVLGEEQYERFRESGGNANDLSLLMLEVSREMQGVLADGTPTRSSTS